MAPLEIAQVRNRAGLVSQVLPVAGSRTWGAVGPRVHAGIRGRVLQPERMLMTFVFDVWVSNVDRHNGNIIAYPRSGKLDFYLIDHGSTLTGAAQFRKVPWRSAYWDNVRRYRPHYPSGLLAYVRHYRQLVPYIHRVQRLPNAVIASAVQNVPKPLLSAQGRALVQSILIQRQKKLPGILWRWARSYHRV